MEANIDQQESETKLESSDFFFLQLTLALIFLGLAFVLSASWHESIRYYASPWVFVTKHCVSVIFGLSLMFIISFTHYRWWKFYAWWLVAGTLIALLLTTKYGIVTGGSRRWLAIGFINLQASEFAKLFAGLIMAKVLVERKHIGYALIAIAAMAALVVKQPDLGTTILIMSSALSVVFASGFNLFVFFGSLISFLFIGFQVVLSTPYQMDRIKYWLDPYSDPLGHGYNLIQSIRAIGSGGLWGAGYGASVQKLGHLPIAYADFIFAIICEEIGFLGALVLLFLFFTWILRALSIVMRVDDDFAKLFGFSLVMVFAFQVLINIGVATGLFPITGMTLPLISFGGSSMLSSCILVGILLNISRFSRSAEF